MLGIFKARKFGSVGTIYFPIHQVPTVVINDTADFPPARGKLSSVNPWPDMYFRKTLYFLVSSWNMELKTSKHEFTDISHQNKQGFEGKKLRGTNFKQGCLLFSYLYFRVYFACYPPESSKIICLTCIWSKFVTLASWYIFTCDSCMLLLRSSTLISLMIWCLFRGLVLLFRSSLDWFNQEDATASVWKWCFNVSPRSSLLANREGPFSGCYWVTSLEWPRMEWHSRRITQTSK